MSSKFDKVRRVINKSEMPSSSVSETKDSSDRYVFHSVIINNKDFLFCIYNTKVSLLVFFAITKCIIVIYLCIKVA